MIHDTYKTAHLFPNKDKVPTSLSSNLVYKFKCWQCENCYIGETRRHLITRIREHLDGRPKDSEITKHVHKGSPDNFEILFRTKYTRTAESLIMKQANNLMNEQDSSVPLLVF